MFSMLNVYVNLEVLVRERYVSSIEVLAHDIYLPIPMKLIQEKYG